ncbi:MAG: hypothetical protein WB853_11560 [Desulfobacterales bacterium]
MNNSFRRNTFEFSTILLLIFVFSFFLNFFWEALHAVYLYQRHDFDASKYITVLLYVSLVDSLVVLGLYLGVGVMWLDLFWIKLFIKSQILVFTGIGVAVAAIIEYLSIFYYHRWKYNEEMPTISGIGISPLFQVSVTGLLAVWLIRELLYGKGLFQNTC